MLSSIVLLLAVLPWSPSPPQAPAPPTLPAPKPFDCSAPEHRQFDFWVGDWDVVPNPATIAPGTPPAPAGQKPGRNLIEKAHNGRVLIENWVATGQTMSWCLHPR